MLAPEELIGEIMRMLNHAIAVGVLGLAVGQTPASAQTEFRNIVDHIHLASPDQEKAVEWYHVHFVGEKTPEGPERLIFGDTRVMFQKRQPTPSLGSVLDHIAFSVADVDAAMRRFQEIGVKIVQPARDVPGLYRTALIEDPWGTRIEIVQDSANTRLHHVHLQAPEPAATLAWFADKLGQTITKLKGLDGINLGSVWLLVQRGASTPSPGHSRSHRVPTVERRQRGGGAESEERADSDGASAAHAPQRDDDAPRLYRRP